MVEKKVGGGGNTFPHWMIVIVGGDSLRSALTKNNRTAPACRSVRARRSIVDETKPHPSKSKAFADDRAPSGDRGVVAIGARDDRGRFRPLCGARSHAADRIGLCHRRHGVACRDVSRKISRAEAVV